MINNKCFTKEWIDSFKKQKEHKSIQANILEKMIHALHLLELLQTNGLHFIFKGGTSLILLLEEGNRFSIYIDIVYSEERAPLEKILNKIVPGSIFTKVELDERRSYKEGIPKAHYIFEFNSAYISNGKGTILLDILFEGHKYPELKELPIKTKWIEVDEEITVTIPSIDAITGDKLTAFAPNTVGIPYYKRDNSFAMEICKQLFDLSRLFPRLTDLNVVRKSFSAFARQEIEYRNHDESFREMMVTPDKVLQDTIDTCLLITKRDTKREEPYKTNFLDLQRGIIAFGTGYLMTGNFRIDDAIIASAKVAHLAAKLLKDDMSPIVYFDESDIDSIIIEDPEWNFLNKLKRQPDKSSFYYWYKTVQLLNNQEKI